MPLFAIVGVILILNIVLVAKLFLGGSGGKHEAGEKNQEAVEVGAKLSLEEFIVNLEGGSDHYLKTSIALGLKKGLQEKQMEEDVAPIRDAILGVLSSKKMDELGTTVGRDRVKEEIKGRVNAALGGNKVVKVYFLTFATQ